MSLSNIVKLGFAALVAALVTTGPLSAAPARTGASSVVIVAGSDVNGDVCTKHPDLPQC